MIKRVLAALILSLALLLPWRLRIWLSEGLGWMAQGVGWLQFRIIRIIVKGLEKEGDGG